MWGYSETTIKEVVKSSDTEFAGAMILDFPASKTVKNKYLLLISHPVYGIFVIVAHMD